MVETSTTGNRRAENLRRTSAERRIRLEGELGAPLSNAQLRGRPGKGELSISVLRLAKNGSPKDKLDYVTREVYRGKSASQARREVRFSNAKFKEAIKGDKTFLKAKGRYTVAVQERFRFIDRDGRSLENVPIVGESRKQFFAYRDALRDAQEGQTAAIRAAGEKRLKAFAKVKLYDAEGKRLHPSTDLKVIRKAEKSMDRDRRARFAEKFYERDAA